MKISFLISTSAPAPYKKYYSVIINYLVGRGHSVSHILAITDSFFEKPIIETIFINRDCHAPQLNEVARNDNKKIMENIFSNFCKTIKESDIVIAECSYPSINIGYEIAYALQYEKEVIILKSNDSNSQITNSDLPYSHKNAHIYTYNKYNILSTLKNALEYNSPKKYKKFNVLFSPTIIAKLNLISQKKNLPKSVYIRELIEKSLALEDV